MATRSVLTMVLIILAIVPFAGQGGMGFGPQVDGYKAQDANSVRAMGGAPLRLRFSKALGTGGSIDYQQEEYGNGFVNVKSRPVMATTVAVAEDFRPGDTLRYTTDGSAPDRTSHFVLFGANEIRVTRTTTFRARLYRPGFLPSEVQSHTVYVRDSVGTDRAVLRK